MLLSSSLYVCMKIRRLKLKIRCMKRILFVVSLVLAGITANAQLFVSGAVNFNTGSTKDTNDDKTKRTNFSIAPEVGYALSDKFEVGLGFEIGTSVTKPPVGDKQKSNNWEIAPFARYSFLQFGKFSVMARGELYVSGNKTTADIKTTNFGLAVVPVLKYDLTDNWALFTNLNFARLAFDYEKVKDGDKTTTFGLRGNSGNVFNVGDITVGFNYYF